VPGAEVTATFGVVIGKLLDNGLILFIDCGGEVNQQEKKHEVVRV
jgi:hypothetical protein